MQINWLSLSLQIHFIIWTNEFGNLDKYICQFVQILFDAKQFSSTVNQFAPFETALSLLLLQKVVGSVKRKVLPFFFRIVGRKFYFDLFFKEFCCKLILESLLEHRTKLSKMPVGCCSNYKLVIQMYHHHMFCHKIGCFDPKLVVLSKKSLVFKNFNILGENTLHRKCPINE